jgi:hypothetical protein
MWLQMWLQRGDEGILVSGSYQWRKWLPCRMVLVSRLQVQQIIQYIHKPAMVAELSKKICTVFARSDAGIVSSNPT